MTAEISDRRAKRNVAVLVAVQAILGAQMPMLIVVGGLAGGQLASNICFATLPLTMMFLSSMTTAPWLSPLMQRRGRRFGFCLGAISGAAGAAVSAYALYMGSFALFLLGSYLAGIYQSAQGFYRFAATDTASEAFKPKAISYVMAGGLLAAIIGPQLNKLVIEASVIPFLGTYLAIIALNLGGMILFFLLDLPKPAGAAKDAPQAQSRSRAELLRDPRIAVAMLCAMVTYALMTLVMTSSPLAVVGCGYTTADANDIVSAHVLAMFAPSFFTGHLIARFGVERIIALGMIALAGAGAVALSGVALGNFYLALILLGLGWNFGFIGSTSMLAGAHSQAERGVVQGMNDMVVFGMVTLASLASGGLMNCAGGSPEAGWSAVNLAMLPFLTVAAASLIWLARQQKRAAL